MTTQMILALAVLVFMIVLIMFDILPFGAPPLLACMLIVVCGLADIPSAFSGFTNKSVLMVAFFMVVMAAVQKTSFMDKIRQAMLKFLNKGGYKSYAVLIIIVMLGCSLVGSGSTGYYVLILSLIASLPYSEALPSSKLFLPLGFATNHPLIPLNCALVYGLAKGFLESAGYLDTVPMSKVIIVNFILSIGFLVWALAAWKVLPNYKIDDEETEEGAEVERRAKELDAKKPLSKTQENMSVVMFLIAVIAMMFVGSDNETIATLGYVVPGLCSIFVLLVKAVDFKEYLANMFAPVVIMMAGVVGVADALGNTGFTAMVGQKVADLGANTNGIIIVFLFCLLTSTAATFTGSNIGSATIFAPIAIASCIALGLNPVAAGVAVTISAWNGGYMPIDGLPALIMGMGKYKLPQFWAFTVPMYFVRLIFLSVGACLVFPL